MNYPMLHPLLIAAAMNDSSPLKTPITTFTLEVLYVDKLEYWVEEVLLRIVVRSTIRVPCRSEYVVVETTVRGQRDGRVDKCCGWTANDQCSQGEIHAHMMVSSEVYLLFCILLNKPNNCNKKTNTQGLMAPSR